MSSTSNDTAVEGRTRLEETMYLILSPLLLIVGLAWLVVVVISLSLRKGLARLSLWLARPRTP